MRAIRFLVTAVVLCGGLLSARNHRADSAVLPTLESAGIAGPAVALQPARRQALVARDCTGISIRVFGNSIEGALAPRTDPPSVWPDLLQDVLDDSPGAANVTVVDYGVPGSTIVDDSELPGVTGTFTKEVTALPAILNELTPADRARTIVMVAPSSSGLAHLHGSDTPQSVLDRNVNAIVGMMSYLRSIDVPAMILPMNPLTQSGEYLQNIDAHTVVHAFNAALTQLGLLRADMEVSPLQGPDGFGVPGYFDDAVNGVGEYQGLVDGVHPDADGRRALAEGYASSSQLNALLSQRCLSRLG